MRKKKCFQGSCHNDHDSTSSQDILGTKNKRDAQKIGNGHKTEYNQDCNEY